MKDVNIVIGRFMPLTKGHESIFKKMYKENGFPTVICCIHNSKFDAKHPFSDDLISQEINICLKGKPYYENHIFVKSAAIDIVGKQLNNAGYCPHLWGCGSDRAVPFKHMADNPKYRANGKLPEDFKVFVVDRDETADDVSGISATKVREALKADDKKSFEKMMPEGAVKLYDKFKDAMSMIKESHYISLSDFCKNSII